MVPASIVRTSSSSPRCHEARARRARNDQRFQSETAPHRERPRLPSAETRRTACPPLGKSAARFPTSSRARRAGTPAESRRVFERQALPTFPVLLEPVRKRRAPRGPSRTPAPLTLLRWRDWWKPLCEPQFEDRLPWIKKSVRACEYVRYQYVRRRGPDECSIAVFF